MSIDSTPQTGRDSVPLPASPWTPEDICRWYRNREEAEAAETAAEARTRVDQEMRDLGLHELHGRIFDKLVAEFDEVAAADEYRGLSLDECGIVGEYGIDELLHKWRAASKAMSKLDRDRFLKFAADTAARLAEIVAQFGDGNPWPKEDA
jgi:hypothetical protein